MKIAWATIKTYTKPDETKVQIGGDACRELSKKIYEEMKTTETVGLDRVIRT